jgi:hypothetical protein
MRAAELIGPRRFRLTEGAIADPGPGEAQVRVQAVGVCGSDMHSYAEVGIGRTRCDYPIVLGHERREWWSASVGSFGMAGRRRSPASGAVLLSLRALHAGLRQRMREAAFELAGRTRIFRAGESARRDPPRAACEPGRRRAALSSRCRWRCIR